MFRTLSPHVQLIDDIFPTPKMLLKDGVAPPSIDGIPPYLVINVIIPLRWPMDWISDDSYVQIVFVGRISEETLNDGISYRSGSKPLSPALKLWKEYIEMGNAERPDEESDSHVLRLTARMENEEEMNIPFVAQPVLAYNGVPCVVQAESSIRLAANGEWIEITMNGSESSLSSLQAILASYMIQLHLAFGFAIQGVSDEQLPEQLLLASKVQYLDALNARIL